MSDLIDDINITRNRPPSPYADWRKASRVVDLHRAATGGDPAAKARLERADELLRAPANNTTADLAALMPKTVHATPLVAASAPFLDALAQDPGRGIGVPQVARWPVITPIAGHPEKTTITTTVASIAQAAAVVRTSAWGGDFSFQALDFDALSVPWDQLISSALLADLERQLLADLATAATAAADLPTALGAARPGPTHIVGAPAALAGLAATLSTFRTSGLLEPVTTIPTSNAPATKVLVISSPAVEVWVRPVQLGRQLEPDLLGVGIGGWTSGWVGVGVPAAVQAVTIT